MLSLPLFLLLFPHAWSATPLDPVAACREHLKDDIQHQCACDSLIQKDESEKEFGWDVPGLRSSVDAIQEKAKARGYPLIDQDLEPKLREQFSFNNDLLGCHGKISAKVANFVLSEPYCTVRKTGRGSNNYRRNNNNVALAKLPTCQWTDLSEDRSWLTPGKKPSAEYERAHPTNYNVIQSAIPRLAKQEQDRFPLPKAAKDMLTVCDSTIDLAQSKKVADVLEPCKVELENYFPNNQYKLTEEGKSKIIRAFMDPTCNPDRLPVRKVEIKTSSSLLANTGEASKLTFLELSRLRAKAISDVVQESFNIPSEQIQMDYAGTNTSPGTEGTKGPCPYLYNTKKSSWYMKDIYAKGDLLENYRKATLSIFYEDKTTQRKNAAQFRHLIQRCSRIRFQCN